MKNIRSVCIVSGIIILGMVSYVSFSDAASPVKKEIIKGISLVSIPSGSFMMGHDYVNTSGKIDKVNVYYADEQPVHRVTLGAFQIGATEITQGQYRAVTGNNPSVFTGDDNLPVTDLSADEALAFCNKLSEAAGFEPCYDPKTGKCDFTKNGFRLPTEAEWEYSCRAGTITQFAAGNGEKDLARAGWYIGNSGGKTHPVAQKESNAWGLYDMHGNVFEFCYDGYDERYIGGNYTSQSVANPKGIEEFNLRIMRGGGWFSEPSACRSTARSNFWTGGGNYYIGFRVARSIQ
ncbi:MAG: formylglycine-generating enzyme family protein [Candidatus Latescibacterota bacterium]